MSGKGDNYRPTNYMKYDINYTKIDWENINMELVTYYCPCCDRNCKVTTDKEDTKPFNCPYDVDRVEWLVEE